jgi:hypothetical protein
MRFLPRLPAFPWKLPFLTSKTTPEKVNLPTPLDHESFDQGRFDERLEYARAQLYALGNKMEKLGDMDDLNMSLLKERFAKMTDSVEEPVNMSTNDLAVLERGIENVNGVLNNVKKRQQREQQPVHLRDSKTEKVGKKNEVKDGANGRIQESDVKQGQNGTIRTVDHVEGGRRGGQRYNTNC